MYSVLNTLSEYTYFYISKKHYFIHFYCFFLKSLKAFSVSLSTTICRSYSTSVSSHIIFDVRIIVIFTKQLSKYSLTIECCIRHQILQFLSFPDLLKIKKEIRWWVILIFMDRFDDVMNERLNYLLEDFKLILKNIFNWC